MKNILLSSFIAISFVAFTGCSSMDSGVKSTKCGGSKCGADKSSKKCGAK